VFGWKPDDGGGGVATNAVGIESSEERNGKKKDLTQRAQRKSAEDTEKRNPKTQAEACATKT
jgi:hypothetical protein